MSEPKTPLMKYWLLALAATVLDQLIKATVQNSFYFAERLNIIPGFFDLTLLYNTGAAFSFLADAGGWQKFLFLGLAVVICTWLVRAIIRNEFGAIGKWGAAMIIGGAVGNVLDRLFRGHVVDFLLFYVRDWYYPAFNLADCFICVGAVLLIWDSAKHPKKDQAA